MVVTKVEKASKRVSRYTLLQVEPENGSPITLPKQNLAESLLTVLRHVAPEYFTEEHKLHRNCWKTRCDDVESEIISFSKDPVIYSNLRTRVFKERINAKEVKKRDNPGDESTLGWTDLEGENFDPSLVKSLLIEHKMIEYKNPEKDEDGRIVKFAHDCTMPSMCAPGVWGGACGFAYENILTSILTGKKLLEVNKKLFYPAEIYLNSVAVGIFNPTTERVAHTAPKLKKFLEYVEENKPEICLLAGQIYNEINGKSTFESLNERLTKGGYNAQGMTSFGNDLLTLRLGEIDKQIEKLPVFTSSLQEYTFE